MLKLLQPRLSEVVNLRSGWLALQPRKPVLDKRTQLKAKFSWVQLACALFLLELPQGR